jgi:F0F1-type ATP synthase delta subunit
MSASEVKRKLISKIKNSKDESLLRDMYDVIKDESRKEMLILSNDQVQAIREAEDQLSKGKLLTDFEVRKNTSRWLGK